MILVLISIRVQRVQTVGGSTGDNRAMRDSYQTSRMTDPSFCKYFRSCSCIGFYLVSLLVVSPLLVGCPPDDEVPDISYVPTVLEGAWGRQELGVGWKKDESQWYSGNTWHASRIWQDVTYTSYSSWKGVFEILLIEGDCVTIKKYETHIWNSQFDRYIPLVEPSVSQITLCVDNQAGTLCSPNATTLCYARLQ